MKIHPVESSTIKEIGHDALEQKMHVRFNSGTLYEYDDVSAAEFESILIDQSVGSKLRRVIGSKQYRQL